MINLFRVQLEKVLNKVLKSGDVQPLDGFLQWDINEATSISCSQQFLTKLDKLVNRVSCILLQSPICNDSLLCLSETMSILFM